MIRLDKLNKYFNKGKSNEIHVINDTCLEFGNTGLICILGESGSGKTTLLNTLGGLDTFSNGSIIVDDITLSKTSHKEMEKVRNARFGYVFQEKYLLQDCTVAYNISLALNTYELSEEEKNARVDYVLKSVGMLKFKKRLVSQLSGGQQQRIAIARALVKTPDVIFADEPTGSLDEANTMRIMSIIKKISKDCLVILVTHEKRIADFFADRIIYIRDGRVVDDRKQENQKIYQYSDDTNLYLKEFDKETYQNGSIKINLFTNGIKNELILNLVSVNDKFYIQTPEETKVVYLSAGDETQLVEDYKPSLDLEQVEEFDYSLPRLEATKRSKFSFQEICRLARTNIKMFGRKQIIMIVSFLITAALLVIAAADYLTAAAIDKKSVITEDSNYITVTAVRNSSADNSKYIESFQTIFNQFLSDRIAEDLYIASKVKLSFTDKSYDQVTKLYYTLEDFSYVTLDHFDPKDLILGRMPENRNEVIIDQWLIDKFYESDSILKTLLPDTDDFLGLELSSADLSLTITGICDREEPTIFLDKYMGLSLAAPDNTVASLDQLKAYYPGKYDDIKLSKDEILLSESYYDKKVTKEGAQVPINRNLYTVAGTFPDEFGVSYVVDDAYYREECNRAIIDDRKFVIYSKEKDKILQYFAQNLGSFDKSYVDLQVHNTYQEQLAAFEKERSVKLNARFIATLTIFAISMFMLFFTMKSNIIKRAQEISVYRLMGIAKRSILSSFALEVIFITNYTVLPVVLGFSGILKLIAAIPSLRLTIVYPWTAMVILLIFLYLVNIIVGILPVYSIVKLPPARIAEKST